MISEISKHLAQLVLYLELPLSCNIFNILSPISSSPSTPAVATPRDGDGRDVVEAGDDIADGR